jgi:hypothetical protein
MHKRPPALDYDAGDLEPLLPSSSPFDGQGHEPEIFAGETQAFDVVLGGDLHARSKRKASYLL